jgi:ERF superfamily protein
MQQSEQINELAAALSKAQALIQPASKDAENAGFKNAKTGKASKYADLTAVWEACRAPLSTNGLSVIQLPADADAGRVALTSMLMHASGQYISSTFSMRLMQDTPHGAGSALTYLRRYALAALVGVVADEDDDGNAASNHNQPASYSKPAPKPAAHSAPAEKPEDERDQLIKAIKAIAPAAKALGVTFPDIAPKDMTTAELHGLYDICQAATNIDA